MADNMEQLYQQRLRRYVTAMRKGKPDRVPIRPFVAEFIGEYAGYNCQDLAQDFQNAFDATLKCCKDFDWDATVPNMVYGWAGLTQAIGMKYYAVPGIHIPATYGFQYVEPAEEEAWMQPDEYDSFTANPVGWLYDVWLPRVSADVVPPGKPNTYRNNLSFVKGGMAMLHYFGSFGTQIARMRSEAGTVSAISGILKAPLDIIADKFRGYLGLCSDLMERPKKVQKLCEALQPHLLHVALMGADPNKNVPVGLWMHRGCVPFVSFEHFETIFWPTLKPIVEELWARGHQTLFYAEGKWGPHLKHFRELPDASIVFHCDKDDIFEVHRVLGDKFCISGGVPNDMLGIGTPQQVRECCKKLINTVGRDGGFIMDAQAIVQNDAKIENIRAMTEATREFGVYSSGVSATIPEPKSPHAPRDYIAEMTQTQIRPGACVHWEDIIKEWPPITSKADLIKRVWENTDALGYLYIWQCVESF